MAAHEALGMSNEWYTPKWVFDALGCEFDTDVAAPEDRRFVCVPARTFITKDSLETDWRGFVWMNPPFGGRGEIAPWLNKFLWHGNGIALTPDRTSAPWFREAWPVADVVLFTKKIRFIRPDGTEGKAPSCGTALWGAGTKARIILESAMGRGLGILAYTPMGRVA